MKLLVEFKIDDDIPALAYVYLTPSGTDRSGIVKRTISYDNEANPGMVNIDLDKDGKVVGIELVGFHYRNE